MSRRKGNPEPAMSLGERVRLQRTAMGMQINQLAELIGVNRNTVANYESGKTEPSSSDLVKIANALGCRILDLLSEDMAIQAPRFVFRAHKSLRKSPVKVCARKYLRAYAEIEEITGAKLTTRLREFAFDPEETPADQWVEMAADATRDTCGIRDCGPENIVYVLENLGVRTVFFDSERKGLDGLSVRQGDICLMMLRNRVQGIERTIFSAAHELGHLTLHPDLFTDNPDEAANGHDYEKEANLFAGCFLVPTADLIRVWKEERLHRLQLVYAIILLKKVFRVSFWCLFERLRQIGLTQTEHPYLVKQVKRVLQIPDRAKMENLEPRPLPTGMLMRSTRFSRLVRSAFIQEKIGVSKVAEMFQVTVNEAKEITVQWMAPNSEMVE